MRAYGTFAAGLSKLAAKAAFSTGAYPPNPLRFAMLSKSVGFPALLRNGPLTRAWFGCNRLCAATDATDCQLIIESDPPDFQEDHFM